MLIAIRNLWYRRAACNWSGIESFNLTLPGILHASAMLAMPIHKRRVAPYEHPVEYIGSTTRPAPWMVVFGFHSAANSCVLSCMTNSDNMRSNVGILELLSPKGGLYGCPDQSHLWVCATHSETIACACVLLIFNHV